MTSSREDVSLLPTWPTAPLFWQTSFLSLLPKAPLCESSLSFFFSFLFSRIDGCSFPFAKGFFPPRLDRAPCSGSRCGSPSLVTSGAPPLPALSEPPLSEEPVPSSGVFDQIGAQPFFSLGAGCPFCTKQRDLLFFCDYALQARASSHIRKRGMPFPLSFPLAFPQYGLHLRICWTWEMTSFFSNGPACFFRDGLFPPL